MDILLEMLPYSKAYEHINTLCDQAREYIIQNKTTEHIIMPITGNNIIFNSLHVYISYYKAGSVR